MGIINKAGACVALAGILLLGGSAYAATPTQRCEEAKLKAQGKLQLCLKKNSAKVLGGKPDASAKCETKFQTALSKAAQIGIAAGTAACRYVDNGDGTVSDLNTGLVWEQKTNDSTVHDVGNIYMWCSSDAPADFCTNGANQPDGTVFTAFLHGLNGGTSPDGVATSGCFTGRCDWRLPTIEELSGIVDLSAAGCPLETPCIDPTFGPAQANFYWSATTDPSLPGYAWLVTFDSGVAGFGYESLPLYARAVRGGL